MLIDVKTATDASPEGFGKAAASFGYAKQAAFYLANWNAANPQDKRDSFLFFVVEKGPPFLCAVYEVEPAHLEIEAQFLDALLMRFAKCERENDFSEGYDTTIMPLQLPAWQEARYNSIMEGGN